MSSTISFIRRLLQLGRRWKYRHRPDMADQHELFDFFEYAKDFKLQSGLRPLLITNDGIFVRTVAGFFVWFDPRCVHGILWGPEKSGVWEPGITKVCLERLKDGGTFLDVGANVGMFSMTVASHLENVEIHAFEPVPANFLVLSNNLTINNLEAKVISNNLAVGRSCGTISMAIDGQLSHVSVTEAESNLQTTGINLVSLDDYCKSNNLTDVKLIKCDVEGFELDVVLGGKELIQSQKPSLILEIEEKWTSRYNYTAKDIFDVLETLGYTGKPILQNGELGHLNVSIEQKLKQSNVFLFDF